MAKNARVAQSTGVRSAAAPSSPHATATMRANRRRDTKPELQIRSMLHRDGLRFRVDMRIETAGPTVRPDVVFRRERVAVFVDGCFWHGCPEHGELPRSNRRFWKEKLAANAKRDRQQDQALAKAGWRVIRVWEHEDPSAAVERIVTAVAHARVPFRGAT